MTVLLECIMALVLLVGTFQVHSYIPSSHVYFFALCLSNLDSRVTCHF